MRLSEFNSAFNTEKRRIQREGADVVKSAEERLRSMVPALDSDEERRIAGSLIERLPRYAAPPAPVSASMQQASEIERNAYEAIGSVEERIAAITSARRKIMEIADHAPADEAPSIRGLTRVLEHLEDNLRDPNWPFDGTPGDGR